MPENSEVVRRWIEAYNTRRDDELVQLAHPDVVLRPFRFEREREHRGLDGVRDWLADADAIGRRPLVTRVVEELDESRVIVEGSMEDAGDVIVVLELADGRIRCADGYLSTRADLERLGIV